MKKNLSYFMKEIKEEIVTAPAPKSFKDENGRALEMEIKVLSNERIRKIQDNYRKRSIALDSKGSPYISGGEVVFKTEYDANRALRHIMAEALVYPDLKSQEMMDFYKCYDISEMPLKVFQNNSDYDYVFRTVMKTIGLIVDDNQSEDDDLKQAKN